MSRVSPSRDRILEAGANLLSLSGFSGVTLGVLAESSQISKSGLFAHFKSKDEMQMALLDRTSQLARDTVVKPALLKPTGLPRLKALVQNWLGWTRKAHLQGGCAFTAGLFELDDQPGPVRDHLLRLETEFHDVLRSLVSESVDAGHLRGDLDQSHFVWELYGIYLSHHASLRFFQDKRADAHALTAFEALLERSNSASVQGAPRLRVKHPVQPSSPRRTRRAQAK